MDKLNTFFQMGGYGFYVWSSYALVLTVLALIALIPLQRWFALKEKMKRSHDE